MHTQYKYMLFSISMHNSIVQLITDYQVSIPKRDTSFLPTLEDLCALPDKNPASKGSLTKTWDIVLLISFNSIPW